MTSKMTKPIQFTITTCVVGQTKNKLQHLDSTETSQQVLPQMIDDFPKFFVSVTEPKILQFSYPCSEDFIPSSSVELVSHGSCHVSVLCIWFHV